jgi:serine protease inhibitor
MSGHSIAAFAWQLLGRRGEADANASGSFLSPISLYIALGMALNGAGEAGIVCCAMFSIILQQQLEHC